MSHNFLKSFTNNAKKVKGTAKLKPSFSGIKAPKKDIDSKNWRVKKSNANQLELNKALESAREKIHTALNRFETKQFTYNQVVSYLKGEIDYKTDCMLKYCKEPTLATID